MHEQLMKRNEKFQKDKKTVNAVVRSLEIIGEAAKNIPKETRIANPVIPWAKMAGMRDKLSHEYFGIDVVLLWNTIKENLPPLKPLLTKIKEHEDKK